MKKGGPVKAKDGLSLQEHTKHKLLIFLRDPMVQSLLFFLTSMSIFLVDYVYPYLNLYVRMKRLPVSMMITTLMVGRMLWTQAFKWLIQGKSLSTKIKFSTKMNEITALVTGGTSGIGKETVLQLLTWGATVIVGYRDEDKKNALVKQVSEDLPAERGTLHLYPLTLDDMNSVKQFADTLLKKNLKINILVNNAGLIQHNCEYTHVGTDVIFTTNHLGHFLLTQLLLDNLKKNNARVINVSSILHSSISTQNVSIQSFSKPDPAKFNGGLQYGFSKICNIWFTRELQKLFDQDPLTTATSYCCHPGVVKTNFQRSKKLTTNIRRLLYVPFSKNSEAGASTQLYLCAENKEKLIPGIYYAECKPGLVINTACDDNLSKELWDYSNELIKPYLINTNK